MNENKINGISMIPFGLLAGYPAEKAWDTDGYLCGETGCGLCRLYQLREAGITHLKLVGRGNCYYK